MRERSRRCAVDLFVYGTLMDDALVMQLTGRRFRKEPARLPAYRKVAPEDDYPYIVRDGACVVEGFVLCDLDEEALRAFDLYEDERLYRRAPVTVDLGGTPRECLVYVRRDDGG